MYTYAWYHWLTFFYMYCFFGWIFESTYVSLKTRRPVNRGFLRLPMIPLYGTGAVMMLWVSLPVKDNLFLVYISGVIAATLLEYVTGYVMERLFKVKYWDYSNQPFNLDGYICLTSSIAWGFLTILMTEVLHRPVEQLVLDLNPAVEWSLLAVITVLFTADTIHSTKEALDLARALEAVTRLRGELDELQVQLALLKAETVQNIQEHIDTPRRPLSLRRAPALGSHLLKGISLSRMQDFRHAPAGGLKKLKAKSEGALVLLKESTGTTRQLLKESTDSTKLLIKKSADATSQLLRESTDARIEALTKKAADNSARLRQLLDSRRHKILRRNPGATSRRFAEALKEFKKD